MPESTPNPHDVEEELKADNRSLPVSRGGREARKIGR